MVLMYLNKTVNCCSPLYFIGLFSSFIIPITIDHTGIVSHLKFISASSVQLWKNKKTMSTLQTSKKFHSNIQIFFPHSLFSDSANLEGEKIGRTHIPRENMSLPSNMQLNDLNTLRKGEKPYK